MPHSLLILLLILCCYLIGSVPFGVLAGKICGVDVRTIGSGNVGATNVWRALGPAAGISVFVLDAAKGLAGPVLGRLFLGSGAHWGVALCALAAVLGHIFSVFLKFKGGKGIATGLGVMTGLWPLGAGAALLVWIVLFLVSRMVSLASLAACVFLPAFAFYWHLPLAWSLVITVFCAVAFLKHLPNLKRILKGQEPRVSLGRKGASKSTFEEDADHASR